MTATAKKEILKSRNLIIFFETSKPLILYKGYVFRVLVTVGALGAIVHCFEKNPIDAWSVFACMGQGKGYLDKYLHPQPSIPNDT